MPIRVWFAAFVLAFGIAPAALAGGPKTHIVKVVSDYENLRMYFSPKMLLIQPGDTVTWVNQADEDHNIVTYPDGYPKGAEAFASPFLHKKNQSWSYTFRVKGTYEYHCVPHLPMGMHGSIVVARPSPAEEFHVPSSAEVKRYRTRLEEFYGEEEFKYKPRSERHKKGY